MTETITYTEELKRAIHIAQQIAKEHHNESYSAPHLLKALLHKDAGLLKYLISQQKDILYLEEWADVRIESVPKASKPGDLIRGDESVYTLLEEAETIRIKLGKEDLDTMCMLAALVIPGAGFTYDELKTLPLSHDEIVKSGLEHAEIHAINAPNVNGSAKGAANGEAAPTNALGKYCKDKTAIAREQKLDPIIGRERETRMIAEVLGRRSKPNVIIIGEPGVGKTALVDGFALNIVAGNVPENLKNARIFELDLGSLVAGASYKGEIEDRLKNILKDLKQFEKAVLFVDELHQLLDKNSGLSGAAQLLKPELARGELTLIGATTNDEYRKYIEKDEAFNRRFEVIKVDEPDEATTLRMLDMIAPYYEKHHGLEITKDAKKEAIRLAKRYDKDRRLPDSAIDLVDRTMAAVKMMGNSSVDELTALKESLTNFDEQHKDVDDAEQQVELKWFYTQLTNKVSQILLAQVEDDTKLDALEDTQAIKQYIASQLDKLLAQAGTSKTVVEKADIMAVVSHKTGIPLGKVQTQEKERLLNMDEWLRKRLVGQDHALKAVAESILESRSGLNKPGQPIGSFFFLGPTGTGKTELAKSLAEFLFADENSLLRFDMSEFKEEHSAALLYGAPPGYVGYEEGGMLVNKIRQKPYSVVLFDEIEKAHNSVFDLFLQILDEGKLHDRLGKVGDFSNAVILFTSNIGSEFIAEKFNEGHLPKSNELMEIMQRHFRPEFLARLTEIVPFAPITEAIVKSIFNIQLNNLLKTLEKQGITLTVTEEATTHLALSGFNQKYGARPLNGVIRNSIRRPLSRKIIAGEITKGDEITLGINEEKELIWSK